MESLKTLSYVFMDFVTIFKLLDYDQSDNAKMQKEIKLRSHLAILLLVIATILAVFYALSSQSMFDGWLSWMTSAWGFFPLSFILWAIAYDIAFIYGVKRNWIPSNTPEIRIKDAIESSENKIVTSINEVNKNINEGEGKIELLIKNVKDSVENGKNTILSNIKDELLSIKKTEIELCNQCDKYSESKKLISEVFKKENTHDKFVKYYCDAIGTNSKSLDSVRTQFKNSSGYSKFLCVLSNSQYFNIQDTKILNKLTDYFILFYPHIGVNGRRIKRIFSKSVIFDTINSKLDETEKGHSDMPQNEECIVNKEKCKWLIQYILTNIISGVETYLLISEEGLTCHADYVVGKTSSVQNRKAYFSYDSGGKDKALVSNDYLLLTILENDFYDRLYGKLDDENSRLIIDAKGGENFYEICKEIDLSLIDIGEVVKNLYNYISDSRLDDLKGGKKELLARLRVLFYKYLEESVKSEEDIPIDTQIDAIIGNGVLSQQQEQSLRRIINKHSKR